MIALQMGILKACQVATGLKKDWYRCINVYADNKLAVESILHPKLGPSQTCPVTTSGHIRKFLKADDRRKVWL